MARIKRTDIYNYDINPSAPDFLVGSDFDNGKATKSYKLEDIFKYFEDAGFITEAPNDGNPYVRQSEGWVLMPTGGSSGDVFSVFGRIGAVTAQVGDYSAFYSQLGHGHDISDITGLQSALDNKIEGVAWGDIAGTLSGQTDLQSALDAKYDDSNPDGYISGVDWGDVGGILANQTDLQSALDSKYDDSNPDGFISGVAWGDITGTLSSQTDLNAALAAKLESVNWGDIGGTLSNQTDLNSALAAKLESVDIADINALGTPSINNFLRGDGEWATIPSELTEQSDVTITSPTEWDRLYYNGSLWVNGRPDIAFTTASTAATDSGKWTKVARVELSAQYDNASAFLGYNNSTNGQEDARAGFLLLRAKQELALGNDPVVAVQSYFLDETSVDIGYVIVQNTPSTIVDFYVQPNNTFTTIHAHKISLDNEDKITWYSESAYEASTPAGLVEDVSTGFLTDAPSDGTTYGRLNGAWTAVASTNLYNSNGSLTGARTVDLNGSELLFDNAGTSIYFNNGRIGVGDINPYFSGSQINATAELQAPEIATYSLNFKPDGTVQSDSVGPVAFFGTLVGGGTSDGYTFSTKNFKDDVLVWSIAGVGAATYGGAGREVEATVGIRNDFTGGEFTVLDMFNQDYDAATEIANSAGWVAIHGGGATAKEVGMWRYDGTTYTPIWELSPSNTWNFGSAVTVEVNGNEVVDAGTLPLNITSAAKGDMLIFNGTNWVDLTVGTNGQVLTADSAEATGVKWSSSAGGGTFSGTVDTNEVAYGTALDTLGGSSNFTFDGTNLSLGATGAELNISRNSGGQYDNVFEALVSDMADAGTAQWLQMRFGQGKTTGDSAEFSYIQSAFNSTGARAFSIGLYNRQFLELYLTPSGAKRVNINAPEIGVEKDTGAQTHTLTFAKPTLSNVTNGTGAVSVVVDATDSTDSDPSVVGVSNMNSGSETGRMEFGDEYNSVTSTYSNGMALRSYHPMYFYGGKSDLSSFTAAGDYPSDSSLAYKFQITGDKTFVIQTDTASPTNNLLEVKDSTSADLFTLNDAGDVDLTGNLTVADEAYGVSWDGSTEVPTKNAVYDQIESLSTIYTANGSLSGTRTVTMGTNQLNWSSGSGDIVMNSGRLGVKQQVFGGARLGDSEFQVGQMDVQSILFKNNSQATVGSLFMNPAFDTFTIKNFNGEDNFIEVTANDLDDASGTRDGNLELGLTLNYTDTGVNSLKIFNNDVGTTPGTIGDKMGILLQTDGTFQSDKAFWMGRFDGTTYTPIFEVSTSNVWNFGSAVTVQVNGNEVYDTGDFSTTDFVAVTGDTMTGSLEVGSTSNVDKEVVVYSSTAAFGSQGGLRLKNGAGQSAYMWLDDSNEVNIQNSSGSARAINIGFNGSVTNFTGPSSWNLNGTTGQVDITTNGDITFTRDGTAIGELIALDGTGVILGSDTGHPVLIRYNNNTKMTVGNSNVTIVDDLTVQGNQIDVEGASPRIRFVESGQTNDWTLIQDGGNISLRKDNGANVRMEGSDDGQTWEFGSGGKVGLTLNDGGGNTNITFNHAGEVPDQSGNAGRIHVNTDSSSGAYMKFELKNNVTGGVAVNTTECLVLTETGNATFINDVIADDFVLSSDMALKKNIEDVEVRDTPIRWRQFNMKKDGRFKMGVIAQEIDQDFPEFVHEKDNGDLSVHYTSLFAHELARKDEQIKDLESRISRLEMIVKELL